MRRQYYLVESSRGLLAWDVDRLVQLSYALRRFEKPISEIRELDEIHWFNERTSFPTVRAVAEHAQMIEESDLAIPIILSFDGRVMDGMHRVAKALNRGMASVWAVQFMEAIDPDFVGVPEEELPYD